MRLPRQPLRLQPLTHLQLQQLTRQPLQQQKQPLQLLPQLLQPLKKKSKTHSVSPLCGKPASLLVLP